MSNNKLTNMAPTLSLGTAAHAQSDLSLPVSSNLHTPTQTLVASPLGAHTPTQPLITSPLGTHTLNLSANTLNALNALNNPSQTLTSLNAPSQTISSLNSSNQTLNALNSPSQVGNPSTQTLLPSPQVTSMVSLPQNFCFSSQPSQTSVSAASQPAALGVTLGFPVAAAAALNSNAISLNTTNIPLNAGTIPLNASTIPLNTGSPISQQLVQSLTVGQQPAICASLPQNLGFPLSPALLAMPSAAGTSGGPFLSTTFSQFPGLSPVIMGSQQSVLQGTLMGSAAAGAQLQTLGTLTPQSLSFPVSAGPVVTELSAAAQPSQPADAAPSKPQPHTTLSQSQDPPPPNPSHLQQESESVSGQLCEEDMDQEPSQPSAQHGATSAECVPACEQSEGQVVDGEDVSPAMSPPPQPLTPPVQSQQQAQSSSVTLTHLSSTAPNPPSEMDQPGSEFEPGEAELVHDELGGCEDSVTFKDDGETEDVEGTLVHAQTQALDATIVTQTEAEAHDEPGSDEVCDISPLGGDIKQEALEISETDSPAPVVHTADCSPCSPSSSPVKMEVSSHQAEEAEPLISPTDPADRAQMLCPPTSSYSSSSDVGQLLCPPSVSRVEAASPGSVEMAGLLTSVKQEAMEIEEEEELPLPDSTPGSDDSLDSYCPRHSPSPMASLQLTRADTTTITTTTAAPAYARSRLEDGDGFSDVKQFNTVEPVSVDFEESEFVWEEYLQETGATAVPPTAFKHVECSLQSSFVKGMRVEVANKSQPGTYWVAAVIITCGPLLRLRYEGYEEDGSGDFWCDLSTCEIHPIGWCAENGQLLVPPEGVKDKHKDWMSVLEETLKTAPVAPGYLLDKSTGTSPIEQLKQGMRLELQDVENPTHVWLAAIMENVGGRLYLRVEGMDSGVADFWAFYLSERLHPIGWAKERGYRYIPPRVLTQQGLSESEIQHILDVALEEARQQNLPSHIFKDQSEIREHRFRRGMKVEAVSPNSGNHIGPATVIEVIDQFYFVVEMDDLREVEVEKRTRFCCHSATPTIFPIQWTVFKGIKLTAPPGWPKPDFNWTEYLAHCRAMAAPESCFALDYEEQEFERGMKLESVNPDSPNQICAATITKLVAHLMWVHLDSSTRIIASHVEHVASHNLFPVGWCESNGYQLRPPRRAGVRPGSLCRRVAVVQPEMAEGSQGKEEEKGSTYCPKIYFNHKCFSGPHLSKGRIAELPCSVGPGPLTLVMKEVLTLLISVAYKSSRVLREIQLDGPPNPAMSQQVLKAKYKSKSYRAVVEICRSTNQLEDFCRQVCIKLECCPNLISPHFVGDNCPEHCSQLTKTKYTYYYGKKKRKIGRPPGGHSNLENGPKKPTKRRKRRRLGMVVRKSHPTNGEDGEEEEGDDKTSEASDTPPAHSSSSSSMAMSRLGDHKAHSTSATAAASKRLKRKYTHHIPPPSEIRTRGAKLPRYSFERRTHKKILLSPPTSGVVGLRSKSVQLHKSGKLKRPASPEPSCPLSLSPGKSYIPRSLSCPSPLTIPCPSIPFPMLSPSFLPPPCSPLPLDKNPLHWSVAETVDFIKTTDCAHVAKLFREQEIDGQALLLLTLPAVQEHLELKLGPAIKLCHEIERVKTAFYTRYDTRQSSTHY